MAQSMYKICIFGDGGVDKTTLVNRYLTGVFEEHLKITIGVNFYIKKLQLSGREDRKIYLKNFIILISINDLSIVFFFILVSVYRILFHIPTKPFFTYYLLVILMLDNHIHYLCCTRPDLTDS